MWIKNKEDMERFEKTIGKCKESVIVVTNNGDNYDLKDFRGFYLGLASMLTTNENEEPEVFANCKEDQGLLLGYLKDTQATACVC